MSNALAPGSGGLPAPSPEDQEPTGALEGGNALSPVAAQPSAAAPQPSPMQQHFGGATEEAATQYSKVKEAMGQVTAVRRELDGLLALHDTATTDDLIKAASGITASGAMGPTEVATLLAEAPEGGEALAAWIAEKDQGVQQMEAQLAQALALSRHRMGVAAFRQLLAHGAEAASQRGTQLHQPENPLTIH